MSADWQALKTEAPWRFDDSGKASDAQPADRFFRPTTDFANAFPKLTDLLTSAPA